MKDVHYFRGMFQSHLLENKIAAQAGFSSKREIYDELMRRTEALEAMVDRGLSHYDDVFELLGIYYNGGFESFSSAISGWVPIAER